MTARTLLDGMKRADKMVHCVTRGVLDAKMLFPLVLLTLSLSRALIADRRAPAPWHSLLWYSYSMFMHWNKPANNAGPARGSQQFN